MAKKNAQLPKPLYQINMGREVLFLGAAVTLGITPFLTIDAFNPPKFAFLVLGVSYLIARHWKATRQILEFFVTQMWVMVSLFILTLTLFVNHYSISERLFGFQGRNFGYITLVALIFLGLLSYCAAINGPRYANLVLKSLVWTNFGVCFVYFLQNTGNMLTNFENDYTVLPSTLGNPNFLSAFIGISTIAVLNFILASNQKVFIRFGCSLLALYSLYIIVKSGSIQGLLAFGISILSIFLFVCAKYFSKVVNVLIFLFVGASATLIALGFLGIGSLGAIFQQQTLINRIVYWKIAIRVLQDSPIFGKGFDSYSDHYREFVTNLDFEELGGPVISDSPHNLFLDFAVSGGLLLSGLVVIVIVITNLRVLLFYKKKFSEKKVEIVEAIPYAVFLSLLSVSLISPFQIGVFVWLPIFMGLLLGQVSGIGGVSSIRQDFSSRFLKTSSPIIIVVVTLVCNPVFALLPTVTENRFRIAVEQGNFNKLSAVAVTWPFSGTRAISIAQSFQRATVNPELSMPGSDAVNQAKTLNIASEKIALDAVRINSRQYEAWKFIFGYSSNLSLKNIAKTRLQELEPTNPDWRPVP